MIRYFGSLLLLAAPLFLAGCGGNLRSQQPPAQWTTGFWIWRGYAPPAPPPEGLTVDILYFQAGEIGDRPEIYGNLPDRLPAAREYWMVFRFLHQGVPNAAVIPSLSRTIAELRALGQQQHLNLSGVQLDIDSPTASLGQYAAFLGELRKNLPPGVGLSITALLDWFRDGTQVSQVIQQVDEFVPQFYDVGQPSIFGPTGAIAAKFDASQWGPVFNRFGKRFRIGLSSFGRAVDGRLGFASDLAPIDVASEPAFALETSRDPAGELVLTYRATRKTSVGYASFAPGQAIQFILPTAETIRVAVQSARGIGGNCAGVLFFRWPTFNEVLAMDPSEVLTAAGAGPPARKRAPFIEATNGACATVACADLYFRNAPSLSPVRVRYRIHASAELEYFLPEQRIAVRMSSPSDLELSLPPYGGRSRLLLGRAVSKSLVTFTVQPEP